MMNYVSSAYSPPSQTGSGMNAQQNAGLQTLLSGFDSNNLTEPDAKRLVQGIRQLSIGSSQALGEALTGAGFDAGVIAEKAGLKGERPPPPPNGGEGGPKGEINSEAIAALTLLMEYYGSEELSNEDWEDIFADMADKGIDLSESLLDIRV